MDDKIYSVKSSAHDEGRRVPGLMGRQFANSTKTSRYSRDPDTGLWTRAVAAALCAIVGPSFAHAQVVTEFSLPTPSTNPQSIAAGPDGNIWFTESVFNAGKIGRITPAGVVTEFNLPSSASQAVSITAGPDGNMWFTESAPGGPGHTIGLITPGGAITEFGACGSGVGACSDGGIAFGSDGNLWVTYFDWISRITPAGVESSFSTPDSFMYPNCIAAGSDGNLWYTNGGYGFTNIIGRITPLGVHSFAAFIPSGNGATCITAGPDGNLWFTETSANQIGRVTPTGTITEFSLGTTPYAGLTSIAAGPDGNVWFTEPALNRIAQITPTGVITEFSAGISAGSGLGALTAGPDGNIWFTEPGVNKIGRITTPTPVIPTIDSPSIIPAPINGISTQTPQSTGGCTPGDRKLVLITHGWQPTELGSPNITMLQSMATNIRGQIDQHYSSDSCNWDVSMLDWTPRAWTTFPQEAFANADEVATQAYAKIQARQALVGQYKTVHLIAHSAGSEVVDSLAQKLKKDMPSVIVQETLLDAYNPGGNINNYGCSADWAESYVDMRPNVPAATLLLQPLDIGDENLTLTGALNFDVTQLGDATWPQVSLATIDDIANFGAYHEWPVDWYSSTIAPTSRPYGWPLSIEAGQNSLHTLPSYVSGANRGDRVCLASSGGTYQCPPVTTGPPPFLSVHCGSQFVAIGQSIWDFVASTVVSLTGTVYVNEASFELITGSPASPKANESRAEATDTTTLSPAWLKLNINVPKAASTLQFDAVFSSAQGAAGFLTVFVDGQQVHAREEANITPGATTSISVPTGSLAAGVHWVGFRLDPTNSVESQVQISNVRLGNTTLTSPSIVWRNSNGDVFLWFMSGGTISSSVDLGVIPSSWAIQGTGDFNGDGNSDILWRNSNGDVVTWFMNGPTIASSTDLGVIPASWTVQGTGDFNGDGTTDILWRNSYGDVVVWFMNAGSIASSADLGVIPGDWTIQGTGDFDGDGKTDILWRNATGDVVIWFMNGGTIASSSDLGVIPSDWSIQRTGDFDGDGKSDILWRNVNGDVVVWFMNAGTIASSTDLGVIPSSWTIQGTGDFNGDGKADILWRNANGDVVTWLMNGGAIGSSTDLGVIPTSWAINGVAH